MNFNFSNNLDISLIYAAEHIIDKNLNNNMYLDKSHKTDSKINAYNYNYNKVIKFLEELEVCRPNEDSKLEVFLEKEFQKLSIKQYLLLKYILKYLPDWHIRFRQGINQLSNLKDLNENIYQCLKEVGIFSKPLANNTKELIKVIRNHIYSKENHGKKSDIGLLGENLSMEFEYHKTGKLPEHSSFLDNNIGYDILSYFENNRKRIEVKASEYKTGYITWNEWCKAIESKKYDIPHEFHLWDLSKKDQTFLAILDLSDLDFIPEKNELGHHFETYYINFEAFHKKFKRIDISIKEEKNLNKKEHNY